MANWETINRNEYWKYDSPESNFNLEGNWQKASLDKASEALAQAGIQEMFENDEWNVWVKPENVKKLLTELSNKKDYNDIWRAFGGNTIPQTTAIQIALEMQGIDVWTIDWILWKSTTKWIKEFQRRNWLTVDWKVGPDTMKKLVQTFPRIDQTHKEKGKDPTSTRIERQWHKGLHYGGKLLRWIWIW